MSPSRLAVIALWLSAFVAFAFGHANAGWKYSETAYYGTNEANAGLPKTVTLPDGKKSYFAYDSRGQPTRMWGDVPYPEERGYDAVYGDETQRQTYRGGAGWSGSSWPGSPGTADVTTMSYDAATGLLVAKLDPTGAGYTNVYTPWGRLWTKTLARGVTITNSWTIFDEVASRSYSDGTPGFSVSYTALGQVKQVNDGVTGAVQFSYAVGGELRSTAWGSGPLYLLAITNRISQVYGPDSVELLDQAGAPALQHFRAFDTGTGRLSAISNGVYSVQYGYLPKSDLIASATFKNSGTTRLSTGRGWEFGYRLRSIQNVAGGANVSAHHYVHDERDRRRLATREDSSTWQYEYNDRGELVAGRRFWEDWTPAAGQQFLYGYDNAGNRSGAWGGGDQSGANLRPTGYAVNALNQYSNATNASYVTIAGAATAPATVTVNGEAAYERGEYYARELAAGNGSGPVALGVEAVADWAGTRATNSGSLLIPGVSQTFAYDADGNLTNDTVWNYAWDAENRLKAASSTANVPAAQRVKLEFSYDSMGRRFSKKVYPWNAGLNDWGSATNYTLFIYDGWQLLAELDGFQSIHPLPLVRSYTWGPDITGSLDGAAGIGGLVMLTDYSGGTTHHFPTFDGNGNVTGLVQSDGTVSAVYEYGPFGGLIRATGAEARRNSFLFSTKFYDWETGLNYYGHRYYSAALSRWLNEDPIEEAGGNNLYAFAGNDPVKGFDLLGTVGTVADTTAGTGGASGLAGTSASQAIGLLSRVRNAVDTFNQIQEVASIAYDSIENGELSDEDFEKLLAIAKQAIVQKFQGKIFNALGSAGKAGISQYGKRNLAKGIARIPKSAKLEKQGYNPKTGERWWEYKDQNGRTKIVVEHKDGTVHVGTPKPQSQHHSGGPPRYSPEPGTGHIGED